MDLLMNRENPLENQLVGLDNVDELDDDSQEMTDGSEVDSVDDISIIPGSSIVNILDDDLDDDFNDDFDDDFDDGFVIQPVNFLNLDYYKENNSDLSELSDDQLVSHFQIYGLDE
ncbi:hypothetical protein VB834_14600, partial [Limnoraphis robusta Tam1]